MTTHARLNKGRHKQQVKAEDGELIRLPDHRTAIVYNMSVTGLTDAKISEHLGISLRVVQRELKLHRDTVNRAYGSQPWEDATDALIPKAVKGVDKRLEHDAHLALKFLYGKGILSDKQKLEAVRDTSPTEDQFKAIGEFAKAHPVYRKLLMDAMGLPASEGLGAEGEESVNKQGIVEADVPEYGTHRPVGITYPGDKVDEAEPTEGQGILNQTDPGSPEPPEDRDV